MSAVTPTLGTLSAPAVSVLPRSTHIPKNHADANAALEAMLISLDYASTRYDRRAAETRRHLHTGSTAVSVADALREGDPEMLKAILTSRGALPIRYAVAEGFITPHLAAASLARGAVDPEQVYAATLRELGVSGSEPPHGPTVTGTAPPVATAQTSAVAERISAILTERQALARLAELDAGRAPIHVHRRADLAALPAPTPIWAGWLYTSTPAEIAAPGGVGKSALILGLAAAMHHGVPYLGAPVQQGRTLYIAGEGQHALDRRLRAWELHNGVTEGSTEIDVIYGRKLDAATLIQVRDLVRKGRYAMVVADTFSALSGIRDENSNAETARFIRAFQSAVLDGDPLACPVIVHHVTATIDAQGRRRQKARGASAHRDDNDTMILLDGAADSFRMTTEAAAGGKQKDAEPMTLDGLALRKVGPHVVVVRESEQEQAARETRVRRLVELMVPGSGYTSTELQEMWGLRSKNQFQAIRTEAIDAGWIAKGDGHQGRYIRLA